MHGNAIAAVGPAGIVAMLAADRFNVWVGLAIGVLTILILLPRAIVRTRETAAILRDVWPWRSRSKPVEKTPPDEQDRPPWAH